MRQSNYIAGLVAAITVPFFAAGTVFAHGEDIEYQDPGYGMEYPMESHGASEYCSGCEISDHHGMGHEMMGNHGMGRGRFDAPEIGNGLMESRMYGLELSPEQRKQIARIQSELRKQNWALQGEVLDAQEKLFELFETEYPDAESIGAVYGKIFDIRRRMIEATIKAKNRQHSVLTDEQREEVRKSRYRPEHGGHGPGSSNTEHHDGRHKIGG